MASKDEIISISIYGVLEMEYPKQCKQGMVLFFQTINNKISFESTFTEFFYVRTTLGINSSNRNLPRGAFHALNHVMTGITKITFYTYR